MARLGLFPGLLMFAHGETVTRQRGTAVTDPYSTEPTELDWTNPLEDDIDGCGVADGGSLEPVEAARNAVDSDFDVILPPGSDVTAQDRLVVRGLVCEIAGRPFDWMNPFSGWQPGMIARAKIREG